MQILARPRHAAGFGALVPAALALALTCASGLAQQAPPAASPAASPQGGTGQASGLPPGRRVEDPNLWALLDEAVAVVGDEIITLRDFQGRLQDPSIQEERQQIQRLPEDQRLEAENTLQTEVLADLIERLLRTRAGEDRGFDPGLVERLVEERVDRFRRAQGGPAQFRAWLNRVGFDPESFRQWNERNLYQQAWEGSVTGIQPGPTGRLDRDTYVRPGQLYASYQRLANSPRLTERAIVGFQQGEVELAEMALSFKANGGEEATGALVTELRRRLVNGEEEFDTLGQEFGQGGQAKRIVTDLETVRDASLKTYGHEKLHTFAAHASPGEISQPLQSPLGGLNLYKLVRRTPAKPVAPFASLETQKAVRAWVDKQRDLVRLGRGTEDLLRKVSIQPVDMARYMARPAWLYREDNGGQ